MRSAGTHIKAMKQTIGQPSAQFWRRLQSNSFKTISTASPRSKFSFQNIKRLGDFKWAGLPAAVAAAGHGLEGHPDMCFAIGFAGLHRQTAEPKILCRRITDRPFAGFFGQFHQADLLGGLFHFTDLGQSLRADLIGRRLRRQRLAGRNDLAHRRRGDPHGFGRRRGRF